MTTPFSTALAPQRETASTAVAAQAQAAVQARYVMAIQRPRDLDEVRVRVMKECRRPGFAEAALYRKPVGGSAIIGPSIRFAEAVLRCMTNVLVEVQTTYDDEEKRVIRISVTDLESNLTYPTDKVIQKTVERSQTGKYEPVLDESGKPRQRVNSNGKPVYLVRATEDDLLVKEAAIVSKTIRTNGLRLIPGDILDEAIATVRATLESGAKSDPEAERKKLVDAFAALGVMPPDLKGYLGHDVGQCAPAEIADLRLVYRTLKDGEATWAEIMESREGEAEKKPEAPDERRALVEKVVAAKIRHGELIGNTMRANGVDPMTALEKVDVVILRQIADAIDSATQARAKKPEAANGKGD